MIICTPQEEPNISTWVDRDDTWTTRKRLGDLDGNINRAGMRVWMLPEAAGIDDSRYARTHSRGRFTLNKELPIQKRWILGRPTPLSK